MVKSGLGSFENLVWDPLKIIKEYHQDIDDNPNEYLCAHSSALNFPQEDPIAERVDVRFPR
jgi:hypothetical protein